MQDALACQETSGCGVLKNDETPPRYYTGSTSHLAARLMLHNKGLCSNTSTGRPWHVDVVVEFADER